ncbi:hypothetical protein FFLO_04964 [Filobasidium floriforme]|uniref:Carbonic anhydrase n=1 Tax=Filobasidium floriforme TaxID=5210 RepID=A0A8K0NLV9_9TREE|nr:carbonic anhydrase [Filobasidium floriforme]KAG7530538.1 hypothetical protein FFLO_04964 [Filobasidium floriforme]KAH8080101.1 carbonic anhydrase [Filobasidium floriforme]
MPIPTAPITQLPVNKLDKHIAKNAAWATDFEADQRGLLEKLAKGQQPQLLWFGCSDSRVPESIVLDSKTPGEIFVHRNIANTFSGADDSCHSVLEYGVGHLDIKHVVVVGHTACGGCAAAFKSDPPTSKIEKSSNPDSPLINFLQPLIKLRHSLPDRSTLDDLIVANVKRGVDEICQTEVIKKNWKATEDSDELPVQVHGWMYNLSTGRLQDLGMTRSA